MAATVVIYEKNGAGATIRYGPIAVLDRAVDADALCGSSVAKPTN